MTNGVTPRRFIKLANPRLSDLITEGLGTDKWLSTSAAQGPHPLADDDEFVKKFAAVKQANKVDFSNFAKRKYGFDIDPNTMINTMVKRLHEYKRQALKILSVIATTPTSSPARSPPTTSCRAPSCSAPRPLRATTWPSRPSS